MKEQSYPTKGRRSEKKPWNNVHNIAVKIKAYKEWGHPQLFTIYVFLYFIYCFFSMYNIPKNIIQITILIGYEQSNFIAIYTVPKKEIQSFSAIKNTWQAPKQKTVSYKLLSHSSQWVNYSFHVFHACKCNAYEFDSA